MTGLLTVLLMVQGTVAPLAAPTITVRVTPEHPAIGEPITFEMRVRGPAGTEVRFPVLPDTGTRIEPLDPRVIREASTADALDRTAVYRLIAWDTGAVVLPFGEVVVRSGGRDDKLPIPVRTLTIRSVLPADTTRRVPRPAADPLDAPSLRWRLWLAAAVLLALLLASYRHWHQRRREAADAPPDAIGAARAAFGHARALSLLEAGEPGRYLLVHLGVMRRYLAERWPVAGRDCTAQELTQALPRGDFPILPDRVVRLVARGEEVAFARAPIDASEAQQLGDDARAVVEDLETVWRARRAQLKADRQRIKRKPLA